MICNHCGAEGQIRAEREHPEDEPVLKCQACTRYAGPPRPHEEPERKRYHFFVNGTRHGTAMTYKEGCRCDDCVKAYQDSVLERQKKRRAEKKAAA